MIYLSPVSDHRGSRANLNKEVSERGRENRKKKALWTFVDKTKFTQQPDKSCIFEFAQELSLESIYSTRKKMRVG